MDERINWHSYYVTILADILTKLIEWEEVPKKEPPKKERRKYDASPAKLLYGKTSPAWKNQEWEETSSLPINVVEVFFRRSESPFLMMEEKDYRQAYLMFKANEAWVKVRPVRRINLPDITLYHSLKKNCYLWKHPISGQYRNVGGSEMHDAVIPVLFDVEDLKE